MKTLLLLLFFIPSLAFCQKDREESIAPSANQYGYVNGLRLDSINATYAQVDIAPNTRILAGNFIKKFIFDYGQRWKEEKEARITDKDGKTFQFLNTAEALNFFEFNGWKFTLLNTNPYQILLRKIGK